MITDARLLALLPTEGLSVGSTGMPTASLTRLLGRDVSSLLADLEQRGRVRQFAGGNWIACRPTALVVQYP